MEQGVVWGTLGFTLSLTGALRCWPWSPDEVTTAIPETR